MSSKFLLGISDRALLDLHEALRVEDLNRVSVIIGDTVPEIYIPMLTHGFFYFEVTNEIIRRFVLHVEEREKQPDEVDGLHA